MQNLIQEMFEIYGNRIYRLALRYTGDEGRAQDITQETFLRAFINLDRYDQNRPAGPWLFRIAANLCRNFLRDRREVPTANAGELEDSFEPGPEEQFLQKEKVSELLIALQQLPEIYRDVLLLKHVGELSYAEIGATLGLELTLVKNRLYRGRIMLREALLREGDRVC